MVMIPISYAILAGLVIGWVAVMVENWYDKRARMRWADKYLRGRK